MQPYRCYFLDSANHIVKVELRECVDDANAIRWAESLRDLPPRACPALEIWCRDRMVHRRDLGDRTIVTPGAAEEYRRKARNARERLRLERTINRRRGLAAIADQYDRLADTIEDESGRTRPTTDI